MRVYKDSIITDNLKSVIKTELTQNLINNITSNWQVKPDALVIYDHKYILHEVRNIQVNRKKLATCNDCSISVNNQWFRYSGINESKLFSVARIGVKIWNGILIELLDLTKIPFKRESSNE